MDVAKQGGQIKFDLVQRVILPARWIAASADTLDAGQESGKTGGDVS